VVDLTKVKDEFEKLRYEINTKLSEVETFLGKKDEYKGNDPRDVFEKSKLSVKIDDGLQDIESKLEKINTTLRSQKSKPKKFGDVSHKEQAKGLMEERYHLLKNRHEGLVVDEKKIEDNRTNLEKLDQILQERARGPSDNREPNEHEVQAMENWKNEIADQDIQMQELGRGVKELKGHVKKIGNAIDTTGKNINNVSNQAKKTEKKLETTNAKLKDLLNKIRTGDRICIDILLILILLGLVAVLYNIIKNKLTSSTTATTTATSTNSTARMFLYI
jgi:SYP7 family syntaxin